MNTSVKKRIPTILGLFLLTLGVLSGVILLNAKQMFKLGAQEDTTPTNVKFTNITDNSLTLSFITNLQVRSFVKFSDDKNLFRKINVVREDEKTSTHYFDITDLTPQTNYYIDINVDGIDYYVDNPLIAKTGLKLDSDNSGKIIYGKVYSKSGEELADAIVYVQCGNGSLVSTTTAKDGSWAINLSKTRVSDLSDYINIDEKNTLVQILVQYENSTSFVSTNINNINPLPPIILGNNLDLRNTTSLYDKATVPLPNVFGAKSNSDTFPYTIQNIYKEKQIENNNE